MIICKCKNNINILPKVIGSRFRVQGSKVIIFWHPSLYITILRLASFTHLSAVQDFGRRVGRRVWCEPGTVNAEPLNLGFTMYTKIANFSRYPLAGLFAMRKRWNIRWRSMLQRLFSSRNSDFMEDPARDMALDKALTKTDNAATKNL